MGETEVAGGVLRYLNDTMHPMAAHESSTGTAKELWVAQPVEAPKPMAIELLVPWPAATNGGACPQSPSRRGG